MTRIISGAAGGLRLAVPPVGTRPTSDRVRESLFSALESADAITDTRVLDLYAGSGALALEALSRGATSADLVERDRKAAAVAKTNANAVVRALGGAAARVHQASVQTFLARAGHYDSASHYDLVFTDPPYDIGDATMNADLVALRPALSADALVVIERASRSAEPDWAAAGLELVRMKSYGDTSIWWAQPVA